MPLTSNLDKHSRAHRILFALLALGAPLTAFGHPGHGESGFLPGVLHVWHGFDHVLAAVAVGVWGARIGGRALWALPLAFVTAMAAGAAAGWQLPMVEAAIAASLLALGGLIAIDVRCTSALGVAIVAVFAPFHAAAHVVEMASQAGAASFVLGLVLSTGLLHGAGIAVAIAAHKRPAVLRIGGAPIALAGIWAMVAPAL